MKQKQYQPLSVAEMATILYAAGQGYLDDVPLIKTAEFEHGLLGYLRSNHHDFMTMINETGDYSEEIVKKLKDIIESFKKTFV